MKYLLLVLLLLPFNAFAITPTEKLVLDSINKARVEHKLNKVSISKPLEKSSALKGSYMKKYNFYAHNWNGISWTWFIPIEGELGENLSYTASPKEVVRLWLNSPTHRENLLNPRFKYIGIRALNINAPRPHNAGNNNLAIITHYSD